MLHIVQFSGGAASAWVAKWVADTYGKENTVLLFHDTKAEHEDAYRFKQQVAEYIGLPITEVSDGRGLWQVIEDNGILPGHFIPFCTRILKKEPGEKYFKSLTEEFVIYNGLGVEEWRRVQKGVIREEVIGRTLRCPLFEMKIPNQTVKNIIRNEWGICLPEPYKYLQHNNCIPCFKAGKKHFYKVWQHYPERFAKAKEMETLTDGTVFKDISLAELEKQWGNTRGQVSFEQWEEDAIPCMCAL